MSDVEQGLMVLPDDVVVIRVGEDAEPMFVHGRDIAVLRLDGTD